MVEKKSFPFIPTLLVSGLILYLCYHLIQVLTPFALSLALAYMLNPFVTHFETHGLRRDPVVLAVYLCFALALTIMVTRLLPLVSSEWSRLEGQAPAYIAQSQKFMGSLPVKISRTLPVSSKQVEQWTKSVTDSLFAQIQHIPTYLLGLFPVLSLLILVPFISFYLLVDANKSISGMIQACPSRYVEQALYLISEIDTSLGNYLRGILIEASAVTLGAYIGLLLLGIDHSVAIAAMAGLSSFVPYLGAAIGAVVGGTAAVFQFGTFTAGLKVVALFGAIRFVDDWLLQPIISKHSVHLHPLIFLLSLMVGGEVFGYIGLVFAVPTACVIKSLIKVAWDWYSTEALREDFQHVDINVVPFT